MRAKELKFLFKRVPDTKGSLMQMEIGDTIIISTRDAKTTAIRTAASRIKSRRYIITEDGLINQTRVTRIK